MITASHDLTNSRLRPVYSKPRKDHRVESVQRELILFDVGKAAGGGREANRGNVAAALDLGGFGGGVGQSARGSRNDQVASAYNFACHLGG